MAKIVEIKTNDPRFAVGLSEGANAIELKRVSAENERLKAREGVRARADKIRWQRTQKRLARKYAVRPVGRARGAVLGAWALVWTVLLGMTDFAVRGARK